MLPLHAALATTLFHLFILLPCRTRGMRRMKMKKG
jgi:hypothetical protein